jgi:hypothetical protein
MGDIERWMIYVNADGGLVSLGDDMPCEGDRYVKVVSEDDYNALAQQLAGAVEAENVVRVWEGYRHLGTGDAEMDDALDALRGALGGQ